MLLQCETHESLVELNELCLELFAEQAAVRCAQPSLLLRQVGELWRALDIAARRRAAACPYLLVDAGFADPQRWRRPAPLGVGDAGEAAYGTFFTVPGTTEVARLVFTYAWHLAGARAGVARAAAGGGLRRGAGARARALARAHVAGGGRPRLAARAHRWRRGHAVTDAPARGLFRELEQRGGHPALVAEFVTHFPPQAVFLAARIERHPRV